MQAVLNGAEQMALFFEIMNNKKEFEKWKINLKELLKILRKRKL